MTCPGCSAVCVAYYTFTVPAGVRRGERYSECVHCIAPNDLSTTTTGPNVTDVTRQSQSLHPSARNAQTLAGPGSARTGDLFLAEEGAK